MRGAAASTPSPDLHATRPLLFPKSNPAMSPTHRLPRYRRRGQTWSRMKCVWMRILNSLESWRKIRKEELANGLDVKIARISEKAQECPRLLCWPEHQGVGRRQSGQHLGGSESRVMDSVSMFPEHIAVSGAANMLVAPLHCECSVTESGFPPFYLKKKMQRGKE